MNNHQSCLLSPREKAVKIIKFTRALKNEYFPIHKMYRQWQKTTFFHNQFLCHRYAVGRRRVKRVSTLNKIMIHGKIIRKVANTHIYCLVTKSGPTGSSVHGISQARILYYFQDCHNKISRLGWLKHQKSTVSVWEVSSLKLRYPGCQQCHAPSETCKGTLPWPLPSIWGFAGKRVFLAFQLCDSNPCLH